MHNITVFQLLFEFIDTTTCKIMYNIKIIKLKNKDDYLDIKIRMIILIIKVPKKLRST